MKKTKNYTATGSKTVKPRPWPPRERCILSLASLDTLNMPILIKELNAFLVLLKTLNPSSKTHYHQLDSWSEPIYQFIRSRLDCHGFKNAEPEHNKSIPMVSVWWEIYRALGSVQDSPDLITEVANHHSSALERHNAFLVDIHAILKAISEPEGL